MSLGEHIRALRKGLGYTQEQLGEMVGAHINTVVRWENETRTPNAKALAKLAEALGVDIATLMNGSDEGSAPALPTKATGARAKKEPPRLTYWAEVVEEARAAVKRGDRDELIDVRTLLERALTAVEDGCLAAGLEAKRLPVVAGSEQPRGEHGNAV